MYNTTELSCFTLPIYIKKNKQTHYCVFQKTEYAPLGSGQFIAEMKQQRFI